MRGSFARVPVPAVPKKYVRDVRDVLDLELNKLNKRPVVLATVPVTMVSEARMRPLSRARRIATGPRRIAIACIVSVVDHCRAMRVHLSLHDTSTLVSSQGDVRILLTDAPDRRYFAPETMFGLSECTTWSVACLLYKLITGSPLVRSASAAHTQALRIVGTLRPVHLEPYALEALFDAFDNSVRWRNRAPHLRLPRDATSAERGMLSLALTWTRSPTCHFSSGLFSSAVRRSRAQRSSLYSIVETTSPCTCVRLCVERGGGGGGPGTEEEEEEEDEGGGTEERGPKEKETRTE